MSYQIRHQTYRSVIDAIETAIINKGYALPEEFNDFTFWGNISYDDTKSESIQLTQETGRKHNDGIVFQIHRYNGTYELNMYFWR